MLSLWATEVRLKLQVEGVLSGTVIASSSILSLRASGLCERGNHYTTQPVIASVAKQSPYFEGGKRVPLQYFPQRHKKQNAEIASSLRYAPFLATTGWGEGEIATSAEGHCLLAMTLFERARRPLRYFP